MMVVRAACLGMALMVAGCASRGGDRPEPGHTASNLLVVLRESPGANKQDEALESFGRIATRLADGREVEFEPSWYKFVGDLHLRIVFDGGAQVRSALPEDLARLSLAPEAAIARGVANLRARYGAPLALPWSGGLMQVGGEAPELNSSYLLDRAFWDAQLRKYPDGLVVAVPHRRGVVFGPAGNDELLTKLRFTAAALHATGGPNRLSSALYLYKDSRWSVLQAPQTPFE